VVLGEFEIDLTPTPLQMASGKERTQITRITANLINQIRMNSNLIQIVKSEKQQLTKITVVFLLALFVLLFAWNQISNSDTYQSFNEVYTDFTVKIINGFAAISDVDIKYNAITQILSSGTKWNKLIMPVESYKYFFTAFVFLLLVPIKNWTSSVSIIVFTLLFVALRSAIISYIFLFHKGTLHNVLLVWIDPILFVPMLMLGLYIIQNSRFLNIIYAEIEKRLSESLTISLSKLLFLLIIIPPLPRVIFTYLHSDIMHGIISFILFFSKFFIDITGKTADVTGRFIHLDNNWIDLEYPCIGLGVFTLVAVLIFAIRGNFTKKILYLSIFAFIYLLLNALRLSVLLLYINKTYHEIGLNKLELHDNATYFMYVVAFAGFMGYWFGIGRKVID